MATHSLDIVICSHLHGDSHSLAGCSLAFGSHGLLILGAGTTFTVAIKDNIELLNNWVAFGEGYRPVSITKQGYANPRTRSSLVSLGG